MDLREQNANHIIPPCCHLPVSFRSLVDQCGPIPQIYFLILRMKIIGSVTIKYLSLPGKQNGPILNCVMQWYCDGLPFELGLRFAFDKANSVSGFW